MKLLSPKDKLDTRFYYSTEEARLFFEQLGPVEKQNYFYAELLDVGFMGTYGLLSYLLLKRFFSGRFALLLFLPALWDFIETVLIMMKLLNLNINFLLLSWASTLKWVSGACLGLSLIYRYYKGRQIDA